MRYDKSTNAPDLISGRGRIPRRHSTGRRIVKSVGSGQRTRYFFNGLHNANRKRPTPSRRQNSAIDSPLAPKLATTPALPAHIAWQVSPMTALLKRMEKQHSNGDERPGQHGGGGTVTAKDVERTVDFSTGFIYFVMIRVMARRIAEVKG